MGCDTIASPLMLALLLDPNGDRNAKRILDSDDCEPCPWCEPCDGGEVVANGEPWPVDDVSEPVLVTNECLWAEWKLSTDRCG